MIYFIHAPALSAIKIGIAADPWRRLSKIQSDCPCSLEMLAIGEGDKPEEAALHLRFAAYRQRGEWFAYEGELRAHIATLPPAVKAKPKRSNVVTDFAKRAGISKSYASMILSGTSNPGLKRCAQIYAVTGQKVGRLANVSDEDADTIARLEGFASQDVAA